MFSGVAEVCVAVNVSKSVCHTLLKRCVAAFQKEVAGSRTALGTLPYLPCPFLAKGLQAYQHEKLQTARVA